MSQIALCFLTYGNISKPQIWSNYINTKYNIYLHNKYDFDGEFSKYCIKNTIETDWGNISLVRASLVLFKEAYKNKNNKYFILLSDKCMPLYNSHELYDIIFKYNNNLVSCYYDNNDRYDTFKDEKFIHDRRYFFKQHQWMCLDRDTVKYFIENDYTENYGDEFDIPDEHYFINIIIKYHIPFINYQITWCDWSNEDWHPKEYKCITNDIIKNCIDNKYLFMRKILPETIISSDHLQKFKSQWSNVDENIKEFSFIGDIKEAKVVSVYDGDTIKVVFKFADKLYKWNCRLEHVDTPELRTKNVKEKKYGYIVRDKLREKILNKVVNIKCNEFDKYGRLLIEILQDDDITINQWLIDNKYAFKYEGGTKKNWEEYLNELENIFK